MTHFYLSLKDHIEGLEPPLSFHKLQFLCGISSGTFSLWKAGDRRPSDKDIAKLAEVSELGLDVDTLMGWRAIDEYGTEILEKALKEAKRQKE